MKNIDTSSLEALNPLKDRKRLKQDLREIYKKGRRDLHLVGLQNAQKQAEEADATTRRHHIEKIIRGLCSGLLISTTLHSYLLHLAQKEGFKDLHSFLSQTYIIELLLSTSLIVAESTRFRNNLFKVLNELREEE